MVNGSAVEIKRILLNNSKLSILDKHYLWLFPKSSTNEFEDLPTEDASTPQKLIGIPEQPPNSCPDFKVSFFLLWENEVMFGLTRIFISILWNI